MGALDMGALDMGALDIGAADGAAADEEDAADEEEDDGDDGLAAGVLEPQAARARARPPAAVSTARRLMIMGMLLLTSRDLLRTLHFLDSGTSLRHGKADRSTEVVTGRSPEHWSIPVRGSEPVERQRFSLEG
jgi:hypothetical protein